MMLTQGESRSSYWIRGSGVLRKEDAWANARVQAIMRWKYAKRSGLMGLGIGVAICVAMMVPGVTLAATVLANVAGQMQPGTWAELPTNGLTGGFLTDPCASDHNILEYSDDAMWSPVSREFWFIGGGHTGCGKFIRYTESTNSWTTSPVGTGLGTHDYHLTSMDPVANVMYKLRAVNTEFQKYTRSTDSWSALPAAPGGCIGAIAYFPDRNSVISAYSVGCGGPLEVDEYSVSSNSWSVRATNLPGAVSYHGIAGYSPIHKVVIFGGGNDSRTLYRMNAGGTIQRMTDAPIDLTIWHSTVITTDPVTGDFLVLANGRALWSYNPTTDTWTRLNASSQIPPAELFWYNGSNLYSVVAASNSAYGVAMFLTWNSGNPKMYLYRHAPVSTATPNSPGNVRVP